MKDSVYIKTFQEYCDENIFIFPIISENIYKNIDRIHPLKQKLIFKILENNNILKYCKSIKVFGSSISIKCRWESDIDFAIYLNDNTLEIRNNISEIIGKITEWNYDIIWMNDNNEESDIYLKINKGVELIE